MDKTTHNLLSYQKFLEVCEHALKTDEFQSKNYTSYGGTKISYEVQKDLITIEYTEEGLWRFHFNEGVGEGLTLTEAIANHKERYRENYYN